MEPPAQPRSKKHTSQVAPWGAYGPFDTRLLRNWNRLPAAAATTASVGRAVRHEEARQRREWTAWQALPLLGADEQSAAAVARRRAVLQEAKQKVSYLMKQCLHKSCANYMQQKPKINRHV